MITTFMPGFRGPTLPPWVAARLRAGLGGVCLFSQNIESPAQLRQLTDAIFAENRRALIAVDEEGGDVTRLFARIGSPTPGNAVLGRIDDVDLTRDDAVQIGWQLRRAGCNLNFAPSLDINSCSDNPVIGVRSFGDSAELVARHGVAWVSGLQSTGIAATVKHFPGHGDTAQDSHISLPTVDRSVTELRDRELIPFAAAIDAGVRVVMTSHIVLPQIDADNPATMSRRVLQELLRDELGFDGLIVSDALDMAGAQGVGGTGEAAVRALAAGCDLLCLGTENTDTEIEEIERAVKEAVESGGLEHARVRDAAARVVNLGEALRRAQALRPAQGAEEAQALRQTQGATEAGWVRGFDVRPSSWSARPPKSFTVVRLAAEPNMAVGDTPWGLPDDLIDVEVTAESSGLPPADPTEPVLVVGRDIHRHPFARVAVDRIRAERDQVLVVDMGWPSEDRRYADVATFGSSPVVGRALLAFVRSL